MSISFLDLIQSIAIAFLLITVLFLLSQVER